MQNSLVNGVSKSRNLKGYSSMNMSQSNPDSRMNEEISRSSVPIQNNNWSVTPPREIRRPAPPPNPPPKSPLSSESYGKNGTSSALMKQSPMVPPKSKAVLSSSTRFKQSLKSSSDPDLEESLKNSKRRQHIIKEILSTEKSYVSQLNMIVDLYYLPLSTIAKKSRGQAVMTESEILTVFSNISSIQELNSKFLAKLEEEISKHSGEEEEACIGASFLQFCPFFKMYTQYVNNHENAVKTLMALSKKDKVQKFFSVNERSTLTKGLDLEALLITPIQRIPRYKLLLESLLSCTPDSQPDKDDLVLSLEKVALVAETINKEVKESQNRHILFEIQKQFGKEIDLIAPHRKFMLKEVLTKQCRNSDKEFTFFLFSDFLMYAHGGGIRPYVLHHRIPIDRYFKITDLPDDSINDKCHQWEIRSTERSFIVRAASLEIKTAWIEALRACVDAEEKRIRSRNKNVHDNNNDRQSKSDKGKSGDEEQDSDDLGENHLDSDEWKTAPVWASDNSSTVCQLCSETFGVIRRRHHCRACGKLVCNDCSKGRVVLGNEKKKKERACDECMIKVLNSFDSETLRKSKIPSSLKKESSKSSSIKSLFRKSDYNVDEMRPSGDVINPIPASSNMESLSSKEDDTHKKQWRAIIDVFKQSSKDRNIDDIDDMDENDIDDALQKMKAQDSAKKTQFPSNGKPKVEIVNSDEISSPRSPNKAFVSKKSFSEKTLDLIKESVKAVYVAKTSYNGDTSLDELVLNVGDKLIVQYSMKDEEGFEWWYCQNRSTSKSGWVDPNDLDSAGYYDKASNYKSKGTELIQSGLLGVYQCAFAAKSNPTTEELGMNPKDQVEIYFEHESGYWFGKNTRTGEAGWLDPTKLIL